MAARGQHARSNRGRAASTTRATRMASVIPLGQPILVGHHSEGRDRRYRGRIHETYRRSFEAQSQAAQFRQRAANVGTAGVSSDDPEAIDKLRAKLISLESLQSRMKAGNTIVRDRKLTDAEKIAGLVKLGLKETNAAKALTPDFAGRVGFPDYALKNNGAEIRRVRARIEALEAAQQAPGREPVQGDGCVIEEDRDENRVAIRFEAIPVPEVRARLKAYGFRWSPTRRAWVRMLSNGAWYAARAAMRPLVMATITNDLRRSCEYPERDRLHGADRPEPPSPRPADQSERQVRRRFNGARQDWPRGNRTEARHHHPSAQEPGRRCPVEGHRPAGLHSFAPSERRGPPSCGGPGAGGRPRGACRGAVCRRSTPSRKRRGNDRQRGQEGAPWRLIKP